MTRINVVIADSDQIYLKAIESYIMEYHSQRFHVHLYSKKDAFLRKLETDKDQIDLLMIHPSFFTEEIRITGVIVIISEGGIPRELNQYPVLYKFQRGDKLVAELLRVFSEHNPNDLSIANDQRKTYITLFFSPEGGAGKTTLAITKAAILAGLEQEVLYLNLESIPSTALYFDCEGGEKASQLFYYIKGEGKNLTMKIDGIKMKDPMSQIVYFAPPNHPLEWNEVTITDLVNLIKQLQLSGSYNHIIIDGNNHWDEKTEALLKLSDKSIMVKNSTITSRIKTEAIFKAIEIRDKQLLDKILVCRNQASNNCNFDNEIEREYQRVDFNLPYDPDLLIKRGEFYKVNLDCEVAKTFTKVIEGFY